MLEEKIGIYYYALSLPPNVFIYHVLFYLVLLFLGGAIMYNYQYHG